MSTKTNQTSGPGRPAGKPRRQPRPAPPAAFWPALRASEQAAFLSLSQAIAAVRDKADLLRLLLDTIKPVFGAHDCGLFVVDPDGQHHSDWTVLLPDIDPSATNAALHAAGMGRHPHPGSIIEANMRQAATGPFVMDFQQEYARHPDYPFSAVVRAAGYHSALAARLQVRGQTLGAFFVNALAADVLGPAQLPLFGAMADQVAGAVANILANEEILAREREKTTLLSISAAIAAARSAEELLTVLREKAQLLFDFHDTGLLIVEPDGQHHYDLAVTLPNWDPSASNQRLRELGLLRIPHPGSSLDHVMQEMEASGGPQIEDYRARAQQFDHPFFVTMLEHGHREGLGTLLRSGGKTLGTFWLNALQKNHFQPAQFPLFQALANQVAGAVANILATEDIVQREREKGLLLSLSEDMATIRDRDDLFRVMLTKIKPLVGFEDAVVSVYSPDFTAYKHFVTASPPARLAHPLYPDIVGQYLPVAGNPDEYVLAQLRQQGLLRWDTEAMLTAYPTHFIGGFLRDNGLLHNVYLKLCWAGELIGFLNFHFTHPAAIKEAHYGLYRTIADQIAVAVANILANEDIVAREAEKTVLLSISEAISRISSRAELLRVIYETIQPVLPFDNAGLFIFDEEKDLIYEILDRHTSPDALQQQLDHTQQLGPWQLSASSPRSWWMQEHTVIRTVAEEAAYARHHTGDAQYAAGVAFGLRHMIGGPLFSRGRRLGGLCFNSRQEQQYSETHLFLFKSISEQLSVAVANILATEEIEAREREKSLQLAVNNVLVSRKDRESLCLALAGQLNRLVPFTFFVLNLWTPADHSRYQVALRRQPDGAFASVQREVLGLAPPALSLAERTRLFERPGVCAGAAFEALCAEYPLYAFVREHYGLRSQLRLSLTGLADTRASIVVSGPGAADFRPADYEALHHLLPQITLALDNLLAFERLDQQRREKAAQVAATNLLTGHLEFNALVLALAAPVESLVACDLLHLCLLPPHAAGPAADVAAVKEAGRFRPLPRAEVLRQLPAEALAASLEALRALTDRPRLYVGDEVPAALAPVPLLRYFHDAQGMRAFLLVPLRVGGQVAAGLLLGHRFGYGFTAADVAKAEALAEQMALALAHRFAFAEIASLQRQLEHENSYLQAEIKTAHNFEEIIGSSPALLEVFRQVGQVAGTDTTVCIGGETGTGKELVARALHNGSPRHERLLVKVNCAALPAQLIESELFGHEKGAFTGAHERRLGKFELADGGTIFLDEIGELPLELQAKLLRVLQEKEIERLGGKGPIRTDVRIIAATNRDLAQEVQAGRFRQDLYFRLLVFPLVLPPLRERREDIPALANHFLFQYAKQMGKPHKGVAAGALRELMAHDWPGNIRELQHVLEQAVIVSTKPLLELARPLRPAGPQPGAAPADTFRLQPLHELERQHIVATLRHTKGRIRGAGGAAELLHIKATTLEARMKKLGIGKSYAVQEERGLN